MPRLARVLRARGGSLPLPRGGAARIDVTYVDNVVHAMWLATTNAKLASGSAFNVTNQESAQLGDILRRECALSGWVEVLPLILVSRYIVALYIDC